MSDSDLRFWELTFASVLCVQFHPASELVLNGSSDDVDRAVLRCAYIADRALVVRNARVGEEAIK